jgi:hypothetical protein
MYVERRSSLLCPGKRRGGDMGAELTKGRE